MIVRKTVPVIACPYAEKTIVFMCTLTNITLATIRTGTQAAAHAKGKLLSM